MGKKKLPKGIREKNGTYEARAMINGKKISLYGKDLDALVLAFEAAKERARDNIDERIDTITLDEWFYEWFDEVKTHKLKITSVNTVKNAYKRTFGLYMGNEKLKSIRALDVQRTMNAMYKNGVSVKSIRNALTTVRECFEFALANKMISVNPCIAIEVPWTFKRAKKEIALTQEEQNRILMEVKNTWYEEVFYFMCLTGARVGEIGALTWDDIDFKRKTIRINKSMSCQYADGVKTELVTEPKTFSSTREIPFIGEMEEILMSQKKKVKARKEELGERWRYANEYGNLVFFTNMGSPCNRYNLQKITQRVYKKLLEREAVTAIMEKREPIEIRAFHPHTFRHTFATRCFDKGMEPKGVQQLIGHSSITVTMNIYTHVQEERMKKEVSKLGNAKTINQIRSAFEMPDITALSHG